MLSNEEAKIRIVKRIANEFNGKDKMMFINLGVGTPTLVADYINDKNIFIQAENGMLGVGPKADEDNYDDQIINAGRHVVTEMPGCCYFDSATSFGMIRAGHIDATVLGAFEVDEKGNIANWIIPNGKQLGVGGAMDLVAGVKKVIIAMRHTDKHKNPKIKKQCKLPITGYGEADMVVTELAVFTFEDGKMFLREIAPEVTLEKLKELTEADFIVDQDLKAMMV
ncbi:3-oxoacid CoA-transferase subunit B [Wukongibacter baidiensis]|uniref:3-oxoacid CoA-transferase subunit B n=1 Tax=Wukongibacter baidiensis TaxID=1723361 RepID=UPI003D7F61B5